MIQYRKSNEEDTQMEYTKVALRGETNRAAIALSGWCKTCERMHKYGECKAKVENLGVVTTAAVNYEITKGETENANTTQKFGIFMLQSLVQFNKGNWGQTAEGDKEMNDYDLAELKQGRQGRVLAKYEHEDYRSIFITRSIVDEQGTQMLTVMFTDEY
jgi:hypothetical protein